MQFNREMKRTSTILVSILIDVALLLSGCASLPARLASSEQAVREAAFQELLDAEKVSDPKRAVSAVSDEKDLNRLAMEAKDVSVRIEAVHRISDEAVLGKVALSDTSPFPRWCAVGKITDAETLTAVALKNSTSKFSFLVKTDVDVQIRAVERLHDSRALAQVATGKVPQQVACAAVKRLDDLSALIQIVSSNVPEEVKKVAFERIRIAANDDAPEALSISRSVDLSVLNRLANYQDDWNVRSAAKHRLQKLGEQGLERKDPESILHAAYGEFGEAAQLKVLSISGISKDVYTIAFKGFLSREGGGWSSDYNQDAELIRNCPYDDLVEWVASNINSIVHHDRGYWDERNAKEELVKRGRYSKEKFDDENFRHDAVKSLLFGL